MKKRIFITLAAIFWFQPILYGTAKIGQQNTVESLFANFSKMKNTTHVKLGGFIMSITNLFTDTKGVTNIEVFSFDECEQSVKDHLNDAIKNLKDDSYETLVSTTENGERTKVLIKIKDDFINEIIVVTGGNDPAFVRIKGKIKPDDVSSVIDKNK